MWNTHLFYTTHKEFIILQREWHWARKCSAVTANLANCVALIAADCLVEMWGYNAVRINFVGYSHKNINS
jgi:hypothetical protein